MALLNPTFVFGLLVLLYLSSFVLLAVLRILTGISIQRIGYFSLRRLAYTPRDGCRIEIRGLGLNVHRPTFAQPTWLSIVLSELVVTLDIKELEGNKSADSDGEGSDTEPTTKSKKTVNKSTSRPKPQLSRRPTATVIRSETWKKLTNVKEKIKRLHRNISWLKLVDVVATNSAVNIVDVGNVQVGSFTLAVDTRRKMVDRARFFARRSDSRSKDRQAEWTVTIRSVLFTADGNESMEVLDHLFINVHGYLYKSMEGLREAAVAVKIGRLHIPFDDLQTCMDRFKRCRNDVKTPSTDEPMDIFLGKVIQELDHAGSTNSDLMRTVSDSKEFFSSILRGIKEIQFAVSFLGVTKKVQSIKPGSTPLLLNAAMKEVGIDLHRLDSKSPAHRMYFPAEAIAHEALAAALSISVGLDDGHGQPERLIYIPMATTTIKTTLLSKTVEVLRDGTVDERNANIMFANSVVTSPSVDLDPRHLPLLIALLKSRPKAPKAKSENHHLISRLLPKANYKFSMHEPVVRIKLKPLQKTEDPDDFDLIISSISSISLDMESSHSLFEDLHYTLDGAIRLQSHDLYYQTNNGERFNLITTESLDMKVHLGARPDVYVDITGSLQSASISVIRPEITDGVRQIVRELRIDVEPEKGPVSRPRSGKNFLRSMPSWLLRCQFDASDMNVEIAGIDEEISDDTRGVFIHWDTVSAEYRAHRFDGLQRRPSRRRANSRSVNQSDSDFTPPSSSPRPKKKPQNVGDGRRLTVFARGIEAQIMDAIDILEPEPFFNIPRLELSLGAASDASGPTFNIQVTLRSILAQYSLYRHYAVGVAVMTLRKAFMRTGRDIPRPKQQGSFKEAAPSKDRLAPPGAPQELNGELSTVTPELVTLDFKAALIQLKAEMPHDPSMMLHMYGLELGRQRWSTPYIAARLVRLYTEPPRMRNVWARLVSVKSGRLDFRESRKKTPYGGVVDEKMIDIVTEAVRVAVPHEVIVSQISDNFINVIKAVQQLHHRFKTGTNEYILEKKPEGPKVVPKVSVRTRNFLFELEDGGFEWKLNMIYRTGLVEQTQRIARENAFRVKLKRVREDEIRRGTSKIRSRSTFPRGRPEMADAPGARSRSMDAMNGREDRSSSQRGRVPRYDPETEALQVNGVSKVTEHYARNHLDMFNAQSWKKRIDRACQLSRNSMKDSRGQFWGANQIPEDLEEAENLLEVPPRPALMATIISDLHFTIDKPTFPMKELPNFLHKIGKGMPRDMQYSLLVPMHVGIAMGEAKVTLRDYPLPLLHIPPMKYGQSAKIQAVSLKANFVVAEEFRGVESTRRVRVNVVPPRNSLPGSSNEGSFAIEVRRTIGPVKSYSDVHMDVNSALPTRITWGPCYQPAVQDMMMVIESFTKPQFDPSERVGFWDKLRLNFHSRIHAAWKGDGDVHLALKGTRDPYAVTGNGAGFLMCWRNDIRWSINADDDPKRFLSVESGEYILAIPDFSHEVREQARRQHDVEGYLPDDNYKSEASFKKVVMKLSGKVQVMLGLIFERAIEDGRRSFEFRPHYDIVLKNPHFAKPDENGLPYDAMRGFRSRHIHLSIAVRAPADRNWMSENPGPSRSYNTVHLTPRFFTHFFAWWGLFGQPLSLPIRQGTLFPGREKNSKKFGRHLATVKYNLLLAPLFLSHIYKHKDVEDYSENAVSATGLKVRFDSFSLDLHQRREEFNILGKGRHDDSESKTSGIKIHAAQLDLVSADVRAVSASLKGTTTEAIKKGSIATLMSDSEEKPDLSRFTIPDNDFSWIDMDDFVELDWITPTEPHPDTKILPLAYAPRLTYFRQTDIGGVIAGDPTRTSPFGNEPTHFCVMRHDDDPRRIQGQLIQHRLDQLGVQMQAHAREVGEAELKVIKCDAKDSDAVEEFEAYRKHTHVLREKKEFLETMLNQAYMRAPSSTHRRSNDGRKPSSETVAFQDETIEIPAASEFESEFNNRFVIHNLQLKWNNLLRNIVLRYLHQNSQRRGFTYYLSRPAIKFILDIVEEQNRAKANSNSKPGKAKSTYSRKGRGSRASSMREEESAQDIEERIKKILGEGRKFTSATWSTNADGVVEGSIEDLVTGIAEEFTPQSSYHIRIIAPQTQLQSDKNKKNVVLATAKGMELKVMEVMEKERISDNVSGLVQRRFLVNMDSVQFFVTHQKWFQTSLVSMYVGSKYGAPSGSSWPPWVPIEVVFDFQADPFGFKRVVQKTSAMVRYDKYNTLRLKYNDEVNADDEGFSPKDNVENRMDNLWVEFPTARALCNSSQYYALYVIVLDLLMYNEPMEKTRSERLEKIILASDFSDLSGAPAMVQKLQQRIRQMEEIKEHFQTYSKYLDKKGWEDRLHLERDLAACEDELFFMMKAITSSQRKYDVNSDDSTGLLRWNISVRDIVWHLMQDSSDPLVELQLKDLEYDRTDNSDGSHVNLIRVGKVLGLNLLPDATYPEMVAPYIDPDRPLPPESQNKEMIRVYWHMLEAIAGIPVMDRFEVNLFPIKVQLEREVGKRLFEYIFPGINGDKMSGARNDSPFMLKQTDQDEEDDDDSINSPNGFDTPSYERAYERASSSSSFSAGSGSLELRLRPTLTSNSKAERSPRKALSVNTGGSDSHSFRLFRGPGTSKTMMKKASHESLRSTATPRVSIGRTSTGRSSRDGRESRDSDKKSRFGLGKKQNNEMPPSDDLTKMMTRASHFMTFASIKMPSVVLCLSYRGKDNRNIEDVHDFVFRMPTIEWQNKTWSNLDLALALKKAVMKALISHTGALIGNKLSKHRPNAEQRNKLRELASSSVLIAPSSSGGSQHYPGSLNDSDDSSMYGSSPVDFSRSPPRSIRAGSTHSSIPPSSTMRRRSRSSSVKSRRSYRNGASGAHGLQPPHGHHAPNVPAFLMMTPPTPIEDNRSNRHHAHGIELLRPGTASPQSSVHSSMNSSIHSNVNSSIHSNMNSSIHSNMNNSVHSNLRNSIHGSVHSNIPVPVPVAQQPKPGFRRIPTGIERPKSSLSNHDSGSGVRRKSGTSNLKDKLSALTSRIGHRDTSSSQQDDDSEAVDDTPPVPPVPPIPPTTTRPRTRRSSSQTGPRLGWTPSRMKSG